MNTSSLLSDRVTLEPVWVIALLVLSSTAGVRAETRSSPPLPTLGVIAPLTGPRSAMGKDAVDGIAFAIDELKEAASDLVTVRFEDSQGDPAKGVVGYRKLQIHGISFILTQNSNVSMAVAPLVTADKVIQLAFSTTTPKYSTPDDNTFRVNGPSTPEAEALAAAVEKQVPDGDPVAVVTMEDEFAVTLEARLLETLQRLKIPVLQRETFSVSESDFRPMITKFKQQGIKAVIFLGYQVPAGLFMKQHRELRSPVPHVFGCTAINNKEYFDTAGSSGEGLVITYPRVDLTSAKAVAFRQKFGKDLNWFSASAYDAVMISSRALAQCGPVKDIPCLRRALTAIKNYDGLSGKKSVDDQYGDMQDEYGLFVARGGKFVPL